MDYKYYITPLVCIFLCVGIAAFNDYRHWRHFKKFGISPTKPQTKDGDNKIPKFLKSKMPWVSHPHHKEKDQ